MFLCAKLNRLFRWQADGTEAADIKGISTASDGLTGNEKSHVASHSFTVQIYRSSMDVTSYAHILLYQ